VVVSLLPWATVPHLAIGYMMVSAPGILGDKHTSIYLYGSLGLFIFLLLRNKIGDAVSLVKKKLRVKYYKSKGLEVPHDENDDMIDAPDLYGEINFD
jgi:hypothetical protein